MNRSRIGITFLLVVALLASAATRHMGMEQRRASAVLGQSMTSSSGQSLSSMNSFALVLLLGGLRGPLVMLLWTSTETQKLEKNLEGIDSQIEWIRLLQPEFDTVHIFQIWNKAYNISVQMASLSNKYLTILDALDYAHSIDRERPDNINTMIAMAQVYGEKLGGSTEKTYYRKRVRDETMPHKLRQKLNRNDPGWRRLELDPMLDADGNILKPLLTPTQSAPPRATTNMVINPSEVESYDGADLQFLAKYQPFPNGIDPSAIGYNYYKRAEILQAVAKQRHAQLSEIVIDSRPALALKAWAEAEAEVARRHELVALGMPVPTEKLELEAPAADVPPDQRIVDQKAMEAAAFGYHRTAKVAEDAIVEYKRHLINFRINLDTYESHMDIMRAMHFLAEADANYCDAMTASADRRDPYLARAKENYLASVDAWTIVILRYYIDDYLSDLTFNKKATRNTIQTLTPAERAEIFDRLEKLLPQLNRRDGNAEDRGEFERYIARARQRLQHLP